MFWSFLVEAGLSDNFVQLQAILVVNATAAVADRDNFGTCVNQKARYRWAGFPNPWMATEARLISSFSSRPSTVSSS